MSMHAGRAQYLPGGVSTNTFLGHRRPNCGRPWGQRCRLQCRPAQTHAQRLRKVLLGPQRQAPSPLMHRPLQSLTATRARPPCRSLPASLVVLQLRLPLLPQQSGYSYGGPRCGAGRMKRARLSKVSGRQRGWVRARDAGRW